jgi:hypothetical protein
LAKELGTPIWTPMSSAYLGSLGDATTQRIVSIYYILPKEPKQVLSIRGALVLYDMVLVIEIIVCT